MYLQSLVQQSPHLLVRGCNLVANWLEDGGRNWKLKLEMVIINSGRGLGCVSGEVTGATSMHQYDQVWVSRLVVKSRLRTHMATQALRGPSPAMADEINSVFLSSKEILGCSWKFSLWPCVPSTPLLPPSCLPSFSFFHSFSLLSLSLTGQYFRLQI